MKAIEIIDLDIMPLSAFAWEKICHEIICYKFWNKNSVLFVLKNLKERLFCTSLQDGSIYSVSEQLVNEVSKKWM